MQALLDLQKIRGSKHGFASQGAFNVHTMVLNIPVDELGGDQQVAGVYATTSRRKVTILSSKRDPKQEDGFVQVARQGNPLFNEALVALEDKDLYSRTSPSEDAVLFKKYALTPELAGLIN